MARSFRPLAKISVKISFKSHNRPKKTVWNRGFIRIVDNGEWVELSNFCKDHVNLPIERLYKNKLRGSDVQPYIFSFRLDANHPENEGKKLIRLNFNGNREGYEHALNSINNAFERFSERFKKQAKKLPGPQNNEKKEKKKQKISLKIEKSAKATESVPGLPKTRSAVALQLLQPSQPKPHRWVSEFDRLLGGPEKVPPPKVNDPQEEKRLAEIRRKNDLKLEQRKKEKAEKLKRAIQKVVAEGEVQAKQQKPLGAENGSGLKLVDPEKSRQPVRTVFYGFNNEKDPHNIFTQLLVSLSPGAKPSFKRPVGVRKRLALRQGSVVKKGVKKPRKEPEQKTNSSRKGSNQAEKSEGPSSTSSSKASSSKPAKKVNQESSTASSSQRSEGASSTSSSKESSSKPVKLEKSPSKPTKNVKATTQPPAQPVIDMWPSRIRGFSPCVSPDVSPSPSPKKAPKAPRKPSAKPPKPEISPSSSPKKPSSSSKSSSSKLPKLQKPQKPAKKAPSRKLSAKPLKSVKAEKSRRKLTISSGLELSDDERTRQNKFWGSPARTYEMDLDFEAPMDPPSGETSGYSSWNHSNSGFEDFQDSLEDVKLEPLDPLEPLFDEESEPAVSSIYMSEETGQLERKSSEKKIENVQREQLERRSTEMNIENVHRGQHYIGKTFNDATFIDSRLTDCDIHNSTIINCIIENSSITNSRITT
ncbi:unnamed protein product [Caenorhabditis brenneri]